MARPPVFELHIRPMFRILDHVHMLRLPPAKRVDLMDYHQVRGSHQEILDFLRSGNPMPPNDVGGPWPQEWIDLFDRWKQTGFKQLTAGTGSNFQLTLAGPDRYTLSCDLMLPDSVATAWFEIRAAQPDAQIYDLVIEAGDAAAPAPMAFTVEERIRGPLTVTEVIVNDAAGEHRLSLPTT